jgi:hypothetical protein
MPDSIGSEDNFMGLSEEMLIHEQLARLLLRNRGLGTIILQCHDLRPFDITEG